MRFRAVVGRVEWNVLHGVEKVRGSRGGRGACDSVFRGFPPYLFVFQKTYIFMFCVNNGLKFQKIFGPQKSTSSRKIGLS